MTKLDFLKRVSTYACQYTDSWEKACTMSILSRQFSKSCQKSFGIPLRELLEGSPLFRLAIWEDGTTKVAPALAKYVRGKDAPPLSVEELYKREGVPLPE